MALKRAPKDVDPITGARIASKSLYGKKAGNETISSWPDVRNMYKSGKLKIENLKNYDKPVIDYITGKTDKISDVEYDEPRMYTSKTAAGGSKIDVRFDYKPGGSFYKKAYAAEGKNRPKESEGMERQYYAGMASGKMGSFGSGGSRYKNPTIDVPTVKKSDPREDIGRMPTLKANKITRKPNLVERQKEEEWTAPSKRTPRGGETGAKSITYFKNKGQRGYTYGKEQKMAAAYYGMGQGEGTDVARYKSPGELSEYRKELKGYIKESRSDRKEKTLPAEKREITKMIKLYKEEGKQAKLGQKYIESLPQGQRYMGVRTSDVKRGGSLEDVKTSIKPKKPIRFFTTEAVQGATAQDLKKKTKK
jgi:hypothetical protein